MALCKVLSLCRRSGHNPPGHVSLPLPPPLCSRFVCAFTRIIPPPQVWQLGPEDELEETAHVIEYKDLLQIGQALTQHSPDPFAADPRETPGSFLQLTGSLLEGAFALGLEPEVSLADADHQDKPPPALYIRELPRPPDRPATGFTAAEWLLVRKVMPSTFTRTCLRECAHRHTRTNVCADTHMHAHTHRRTSARCCICCRAFARSSWCLAELVSV